LLSAANKKKIFFEGLEDPLAGIFEYDLSKKDPQPIKLELVGFPKDIIFAPHGIGLHRTENGQKFLFVVNHRVIVNEEKMIFL